jgi:hypothetical protein
MASSALLAEPPRVFIDSSVRSPPQSLRAALRIVDRQALQRIAER